MQGVGPPAPVSAEEKCSSQGQRGPHGGSAIDLKSVLQRERHPQYENMKFSGRSIPRCREDA